MEKDNGEEEVVLYHCFCATMSYFEYEYFFIFFYSFRIN